MYKNPVAQFSKLTASTNCLDVFVDVLPEEFHHFVQDIINGPTANRHEPFHIRGAAAHTHKEACEMQDSIGRPLHFLYKVSLVFAKLRVVIKTESHIVDAKRLNVDDKEGWYERSIAAILISDPPPLETRAYVPETLLLAPC